MIVYKLTCKTGRVYFGSSKNSLKHRASKGWYNCSCKDFEIVKMEVVENVLDPSKLLERENYYIINNECVNKNDAVATKERQLQRNRNNKKLQLYYKNYRQQTLLQERFKCHICNFCYESNFKLKKHLNGYRHELKYNCYLKYGEDWKKHYKKENMKRYEKTRKKKQI